MIRTAALLVLISLAGCDASGLSNPGTSGPTGRVSDARNLTAVKVRTQWKYDLLGKTQQIVQKQVRFPATARFGDAVRYEGYYDSSRDVTWVGVYGNVSCKSDYGTQDNNGYYVTWEQPGRPTSDFPPPWRLADYELLDQPY